MRPEGNQDRASRKNMVNKKEIDPRVTITESDQITMMSSQANTMANFMKFIDQKNIEEEKKVDEEEVQLGTDDDEPVQA